MVLFEVVLVSVNASEDCDCVEDWLVEDNEDVDEDKVDDRLLLCEDAVEELSVLDTVVVDVAVEDESHG